jgi:Zn-finger nucleic acid-binding protein
MERLAGAPDESRAQLPTDGTGNGRAPLDRIFGSCPSCKIGLKSFEVPDQPAALEVCPRCIGVWFDRGELKLLRHSDVVAWLRTVMESVRTSRADR